MAVTYPLARSAWWDTLRIARLSIGLRETATIAQTADGGVLVQSIGQPLWQFDVALHPLSMDDARETLATLRGLKRPGGSALVGPRAEWTPRLDPQGNAASFSVTVASIANDLLAVAFAGLPAGYTLSAGDWFGVQVSGVYWLHQLIEGGSADGSGTTPQLSLRPAVSPALAAGAAVTLADPVCKAAVDPGSVDEGFVADRLVRGLGWRMIQVLR